MSLERNLRCIWMDIVSTDRKSTRLNSSHSSISYAVFCLKKKPPPPGHHPGRLTPPPAGPGRQGGESLDLTPMEITWPPAWISAVRLPGAHKTAAQDFVLT